MANFARPMALAVGSMVLFCAGFSNAGAQDFHETVRGRLTSRDAWSVHGFFTQAYAESDGYTFLGIPDEGTGDYQTMAVQIAFEPSPKDVFVVQFDRETFGDSELGEVRGETALDWAFYERNLTDSFRLRAGRMPLPLGIFNEIRDVGTLLPFYRPPVALYMDGLFIAERIDGLQVGYTRDLGGWRAEGTLYGGQWEEAEVALLEGIDQPEKAEARDVLGLQLWFQTPVDGLRVGGSYYQYSGQWPGSAAASSFAAYAAYTTLSTPREDHRQSWRVSVDGDFGPWILRGEYASSSADSGSGEGWYVQGGWRPNRWLGIFAEVQRATIESSFTTPGGARRVWRQPLHEEEALALNVYLRANWVLKAEIHNTTTMLVEEYASAEEWPVDVRVGIVSLSFSF